MWAGGYMLRGISSVISFLTIFPSPSTDLNTVANYMYIFPLVGIVIGLVIGGLGYGLSLFLEPLVVGLLVAGALVVITGLHHIDGLADFADGLMAKGNKEKKLQAMKDLSTGSAGIVSVVLYLIGLVLTISLISGFALFQALLLAEIIAKFSMVLQASLGISAKPGSNTLFLQLMKDKKRIVVAGVITIIPLVVLGGVTGLIVFSVGIGLTILILAISNKNFGGITGDVLGATNELTRLSSLIIFVSL